MTKAEKSVIEIYETGEDKYCPFLIIQPIGAIIRWSAGYRSPQEDAEAREDAIARANRIVEALEKCINTGNPLKVRR